MKSHGNSSYSSPMLLVHSFIHSIIHSLSFFSTVRSNRARDRCRKSCLWSFHSLSYSSTVSWIELGEGLIELGLGRDLRINNARRTVLARVSGLVFYHKFVSWWTREIYWQTQGRGQTDTRPPVADGWAGASNPHPHPIHIQKKQLKRSFSHFSTRGHGLTNGRTDG